MLRASFLEILASTGNRVLRKVGEADGGWKRGSRGRRDHQGDNRRFSRRWIPRDWLFRTSWSGGGADSLSPRKPLVGDEEREFYVPKWNYSEKVRADVAAPANTDDGASRQAFFGIPRQERIDMVRSFVSVW